MDAVDAGRVVDIIAARDLTDWLAPFTTALVHRKAMNASEFLA